MREIFVNLSHFLVPEIGLEPIRFVQPRDFKAERPQNGDICENQKSHQTRRFCAETRQKMPETRPFPSAPILSRFVIFPLLPKTFHTQNGQHLFRCRPFLFAHFLNKSDSDAITSIHSNSRFYLNRPLQGSTWL